MVDLLMIDMQPNENEIRNCVNSIPQTELFELLDVIKVGIGLIF